MVSDEVSVCGRAVELTRLTCKRLYSFTHAKRLEKSRIFWKEVEDSRTTDNMFGQHTGIRT